MPNRPISKLTLYGDSISGNCLKTKWTADYLDVDHDWVEISVVEGGTRSDAFMQMNPSGQVPVMRLPDGRILPQSNAIMLYLAETQRGQDLIPVDPFERAKMMSWLFWEQYSHEPYIAVRRFRKKFMNMTDDELDPQLLARGRRALGVMEMQLTFADYFVGQSVTLADIALVAYTRVAHEGGFDLSEFPSVQRWVARVETDLGIEHDRIAMIAQPGGLPTARRVIDASGCFVMPGAIDIHFHVRAPGHPQRGTFTSETRAAAAGANSRSSAMAMPTASANRRPMSRRARSRG